MKSRNTSPKVINGRVQTEPIDSNTSCEICGRSTQDGVKLIRDYSNSSGMPRGILCLECKAGITLAKEDPNILRKLASYREKTQTK